MLSGTGDDPTETVQLNWNDYTGWPKGVKQYEIWRKLDKAPSYTLYKTLGNDQSDWAAANAREGFTHCYRIKAVEAEGMGGLSWSNEVCLTFENPLFIPNVITPNGDGLNDAWVILNLELYGTHDLTIVNRYGKVVLQTHAYQQDWRGEGLSPGLYYYLLTTNRDHQSFRGWVQVLR